MRQVYSAYSRWSHAPGWGGRWGCAGGRGMCSYGTVPDAACHATRGHTWACPKAQIPPSRAQIRPIRDLGLHARTSVATHRRPSSALPRHLLPCIGVDNLVGDPLPPTALMISGHGRRATLPTTPPPPYLAEGRGGVQGGCGAAGGPIAGPAPRPTALDRAVATTGPLEWEVGEPPGPHPPRPPVNVVGTSGPRWEAGRARIGRRGLPHPPHSRWGLRYHRQGGSTIARGGTRKKGGRGWVDACTS